MEKIRTPDHRFENLPEYPFEPNYVEIPDNLMIHYVDEGDGPTVLLLHGEPSWSYLYRKMIPILVAQGFRAIAPDLIGFGRSDKLIHQEDYSYERHLGWMKAFIERLDLGHINLFCQDWGGLIGLRAVADLPELFDRVIAANTVLPMSGAQAPEAFKQWRDFSQNVPDFQAGKIIDTATTSKLTDEIISAYDAPFPDDQYKAGARVFPLLVPFSDTDTHQVLPACDEAWKRLQTFEKPFLTLFSDSDPIMVGLEKLFQKMVPGCRNMPHEIIKDAAHFLQEDKGELIANKVASFIKNH